MDFLAKEHWEFVQSYDRNLAVGARKGEKATSITILYDTTDPKFDLHRNYEDDPTVSWDEGEVSVVHDRGGGPWHRNTILAVRARLPPQRRPPVTRADMSSTRYLVFHMDNKAAANKTYMSLDSVIVR